MSILSRPRRRAARTARAAWAVLALALAAPWPAGADDRADHDRARAAVQAGEVMPLPALLERLQRTHPGQVLELELERDDGARRWVYEVVLLHADGQRLKLDVDARTGEVLKLRRRGGDAGR